ncbi:hypothetical protein RPMA_16680 [Tardiphaga alba]|uniref:Uncharacterized protein n=1 Tax=Tardiphaga alba TaxID=340268 RepID=A0ABX8A9H1_9BRAD|nr:hypothetical protein [Tardiphaga alba]QUS40288.1 hypothetical protein RPMA_16680 [Tardiphaga alba]
MKMIALVAMLAMLLLGVFGTDASVGGPVGMMMVALAAMLATGIHDAAAHARGPLGWIASLVAAFVGGIAAVIVFGMGLMEAILPMLHLEGSLASSQHPLKYVLFAAMGGITVLGSWGALLIVDRLRHMTARRASR